jgi:phosphatidylglycerophosphate synthase
VATERVRLGDLTTVPNLVSLSRLPLVVLIVLLLESVWRYPLFALVVATDGLDGWLARRLDQTTALGALLDPALDKLTALALFLALFPRTGLVTEYAALFFARDAVVVSLGLLLPLVDPADVGEIGARPAGKLVTNLQFLVMVALLVPHEPATRALLWATGLASTVAVGDYAALVARALTDRAWVHGRPGLIAAHAASAAGFAALVALLLADELTALVPAAG